MRNLLIIAVIGVLALACKKDKTSIYKDEEYKKSILGKWYVASRYEVIHTSIYGDSSGGYDNSNIRDTVVFGTKKGEQIEGVDYFIRQNTLLQPIKVSINRYDTIREYIRSITENEMILYRFFDKTKTIHPGDTKSITSVFIKAP